MKPTLGSSLALCGLNPHRATPAQKLFLARSNRNHQWGFCKGHVEVGDGSLRGTALRELEEESGISAGEVTLLPHWHDTCQYTFTRKGVTQHKIVHWFAGTCPASARAALSDETDDFAWLGLGAACRKLKKGDLKR